MRVLVTGATGFVGSHTAKALQDAGHTVRALVHTPGKVESQLARVGVDLDELEAADGDVTDFDSVEAAIRGCDAVVHAAAVVSTDPSKDAMVEAVNVRSAMIVFDAAVEAGCDPMVHVSSSAAMFPFQTDPVTGDHPVGTASYAYAHSKAHCEYIARSLQAAGHNVVIVYPGMVVGPDDYGASTQLNPLKLWVTKPFPKSRGYTLTLVDVRDVAAVITASMQPGAGSKRYPLFGHHVTGNELLALLCEVTGRDLKSVRMPRALFSVWGRLGDLARRVGVDLVVTSEAVGYMFNYCAGDDAHTERDTGVKLRPAAETLTDTYAWMHETGHITAAQAGTAARPAN